MRSDEFLIIVRRSVIAAMTTAGVLLNVACSSAPSTQPARIEAETQPAESPFVMAAASLPAGFPPPGPADHVIVKQYPAYRLARIGKFNRADGQTDAQGMFMALVKHVDRNDIPATSPIEATYAPPIIDAQADPGSAKKSRPEAMSFIYPNASHGTIGPDPQDPRIAVLDLPASTYLSIGIRGSYSSQNFTAAYVRLTASLAKSPGEFSVVGPPRYLFYNSPLLPAFASFGEVQLPIARLQEAAASQPADAR